MRIAVTYDNGNVFQHFGKTEAFKLYEVEDNKFISSEVISNEGAGHEALAGVLGNHNVDVLVCGGIGGGAKAALESEGIEVCSGAEGDADAAVEAYLKGELVSGGVNCDHHHEGHDHEECEGGCGEGGCHCGGGCHRDLEILYEGKNAGKTCKVHYTGTFNDGTKFDSSLDRGEPLEFICGTGMMISGFDKAVLEMNPGDSTDIHLMPEEAYGMPDPEAIVTMPIKNLPGCESFKIGDEAYLETPMGQPFRVKVVEKTEDTITLDANHEMAGKELNFHIELVSVE